MRMSHSERPLVGSWTWSSAPARGWRANVMDAPTRSGSQRVRPTRIAGAAECSSARRRRARAARRFRRVDGVSLLEIVTNIACVTPSFGKIAGLAHIGQPDQDNFGWVLE